MSDLPDGWLETEIGQIADIVTGGTPSKSQPDYYGGDHPFFKPGDLDQGGLLTRAEDTLTDDGLGHAKPLPAGSLLVTCIGNLGKSGLTSTLSATNQQINAVLPSRAADRWYLYYWSRTIRSWLEDNSSATTVAIINKGRFSRAPINLPPLAEQRRIVEKLDALTARTARARADLDRIPALAARYKQAVLAKAFSGELTADWRARNTSEQVQTTLEAIRIERSSDKRLSKRRRIGTEPAVDLPFGWHWISPDEVAGDQRYSLGIGPFGSNLVQGDYRESGTRLIFVRDIRRQRFDDENARYVSTDKAADLHQHAVSGGEVLITKMGDPPGDTAVYPLDAGSAIITADCVKLAPHPRLSTSPFLAFAIKSDVVKVQLAEITAGVAQQKISLDRFRTIALPIAPRSEQDEICNRINRAFADIDRMVTEAAAARRLLDRLDQSVLAKAFRGELVPQDPSDEPASVLLDRIRAERAAAPKAKRGRRKAAT